jgi:hypothetical protein
MRQRLGLIPSLFVLLLFSHLQRLCGINWRLQLADAYFLLSFMLAGSLWQWAKQRVPGVEQKRAREHVHANSRLYQDYLNFGAGFAVIVFDEDLPASGIRLALKLLFGIVLLLLAPVLWIGRAIYRGARTVR